MTKDQQGRCAVLWRELLGAGHVRGMLAHEDIAQSGGDEPGDRARVVDSVDGGIDTTLWCSTDGDCYESVFGLPRWLTMRAFPDFSDPATLGCILAMLREAAGDPSLFVGNTVLNSGSVVWLVAFTNSTAYVAAETEAEAMLLAIKEVKR